MSLNHKLLEKEIIRYLRKQPQKYGDISNIVNKFINGDIKIKDQIHKHLVYLIDRDVITIKDLPNDPLMAQIDWWGTFPGHNPTAGFIAEDLKAQLSSGYEKLSWFEKNKTWGEIIKIVMPVLLGYFLGFLTFSPKQTDNTPLQKQRQDTMKQLPKNESLKKSNEPSRKISNKSEDSFIYKRAAKYFDTLNPKQ